MKIGIVSIDVNTPMFNYGAILHTWAFETFLKKHGFRDIELINYFPEEVERQNRFFPVFDLLTNCHRRLSLHYVAHYLTYLKKLIKISKFNKQLSLSKKKYRFSTVRKAKNWEYDVVIVEDDVLWSKHFLCRSKLVDPFFFLNHKGLSNIKKISYSVSMADCDFTSKEMETICSYLTSFDAISVRETYARDFLKEYGVKSDVVADAVFLLNKEDYSSIISRRFKEKKYVLLYLPAQNNIRLRKEAEAYAKENGLDIIEINNRVISKKGLIGDAGVEDFLSAIYYSQSVFTNSFHAMCFSLIFQKNFYVYSRLSSGKLIDLCKVFGLEKRFVDEEKSYKELQPLNYDMINLKVEEYRSFSQNWLLSTLFRLLEK